jgi:hypothetical protein
MSRYVVTEDGLPIGYDREAGRRWEGGTAVNGVRYPAGLTGPSPGPASPRSS